SPAPDVVQFAVCEALRKPTPTGLLKLFWPTSIVTVAEAAVEFVRAVFVSSTNARAGLPGEFPVSWTPTTPPPPKLTPLIVPVNWMALLPIAVVNPAPQSAAELSHVTVVAPTVILINDDACACGTVQRASIMAIVIPNRSLFISISLKPEIFQY